MSGLTPAILCSCFGNTLLHPPWSLFIPITNTHSDSKRMPRTSPLAPFSHRKYQVMDGTPLPTYPSHSTPQNTITTSSTKNSLPLSMPSTIGECTSKVHVGYLRYGPTIRTFSTSPLPELFLADKPGGCFSYLASISLSYTNLESPIVLMLCPGIQT